MKGPKVFPGNLWRGNWRAARGKLTAVLGRLAVLGPFSKFPGDVLPIVLKLIKIILVIFLLTTFTAGIIG